ncbi:putative disease resistance protein isoform X1 [Cinnamomum micranthum f. kanehirae]|uniref:Putative disease resistance protein isoform X1 n=1 Tax=Cinnamomum micranthum f. kanehirae TaxID=337451 RepID=A0A3S3NI39_9MAGN|nr:putative disease resistance protein isoform X1 [Cinnamomum micranthum f. kanehirae]
METLESKRRTLIATNNDIKRRVEFAELQGGSASNQVTHWLQEVESMERKVSDTQRDFEEQKNCWKGRFPNYYRRRKISKKSSILIGQVDELITNGKFENGVTEPLPLATNALPTMPIVGKTAELTRQEIWNCILGTEKRIIGVHGMGGVGKTTIMRNIHNDLSQQSESKHFDCFIWITVSNDVDVNKLQRKIAKELKIDMEEDDDEDGAARKIFNALKRRKKFLLILDDMWDAFNLDEVGIPLPSEENGCKVVLSTRDKGICGQMHAHAIEVRVLSEEESWEFFKDIVVVGGVFLSKDIENLAKGVAKECCNLPLAIKTVGGSMCGVDNAAVWMDALKDLKEANGGFKGIDKLYSMGDTLLQYCFLFCSLYPEDHKISANELINNWIYEGLIDKRGPEKIISQRAYILDQLVKVSMLERCDNRVGIWQSTYKSRESTICDLCRSAITGFSMGCRRCYEDLLMLNDIKLRFSLSSTNIKSLANSVSNLKNLRALILTWCRNLEEMPSLEELEELMVLDLNSNQNSRAAIRSGSNAGIIPRLSHLEELTMRESRWKWSSKTGEGAGIEEIMKLHSTGYSGYSIPRIVQFPSARQIEQVANDEKILSCYR